MEQRPLGQTGVSVSAIGFGGAAISGEGPGYGYGAVSEAEAIALCHALLDAGINLFDTAPIYGLGRSEQRLGKALRDRRERAVLVSKCGNVWSADGTGSADNRPETVLRMLDQSLRDLQTDYIDLYLVHWPDSNVPIGETLGALAEAQRAGKIRFIGLSNTYPEHLAQAREAAPIAALQGPLHLFESWSSDHVLPLVRQHELGFMGYGTLDKGILSGRVTPEREYDPTDVRATAPWWRDADHQPKFRTMERLAPLLAAAGHSPLELALGWCLQFPEVSTALVGIKSRAQLESAVAATQHLPPPDLIAEARRIAQSEGAVRG